MASSMDSSKGISHEADPQYSSAGEPVNEVDEFSVLLLAEEVATLLDIEISESTSLVQTALEVLGLSIDKRQENDLVDASTSNNGSNIGPSSSNEYSSIGLNADARRQEIVDFAVSAHFDKTHENFERNTHISIEKEIEPEFESDDKLKLTWVNIDLEGCDSQRKVAYCKEPSRENVSKSSLNYDSEEGRRREQGQDRDRLFSHSPVKESAGRLARRGESPKVRRTIQTTLSFKKLNASSSKGEPESSGEESRKRPRTWVTSAVVDSRCEARKDEESQSTFFLGKSESHITDKMKLKTEDVHLASTGLELCKKYESTVPSLKGAAYSSSANDLNHLLPYTLPDVFSPVFNAREVAESYRISGHSSPPFTHLCQALSAVGATNKRTQKRRALTNILLAFLNLDRSTLSKEFQATKRNNTKCDGHPFDSFSERSAVLASVLLASNAANSIYKLNIGVSAISRALCSALACTATYLRKAAGDAGELGDAAAKILGAKGKSGSLESIGKQQTRLCWSTTVKMLTVASVINTLRDIDKIGTSGSSGKGVEQRRIDIMAKLFSAARTKDELRFAVKIFCGHIRTGATLITILECLAMAVALHHNDCTMHGQHNKGSFLRPVNSPKNLERQMNEAQRAVRLAYARHHNLETCVICVVVAGVEHLDEYCTTAVGVPLQPMLATPCNGVEEVMQHYKKGHLGLNRRGKRLGRSEVQSSCSEHQCFLTAEFKYDGQRAQIHISRSPGNRDLLQVLIFSRNLENVTSRFEEVVIWFKTRGLAEGVDSFILDAELCAVRRATNTTSAATSGCILPFQVLSTLRKENKDVGTRSNEMVVLQSDVGVCVFAFDLMFLNGNSLVDLPLSQRRSFLIRYFTKILDPNYFEFARRIDLKKSDPLKNIEVFLLEAIGAGRCEGIMLKSLLSCYDGYSPRDKSGGWGGWRKLKKDYVDSLADSFDVVPIGAWRGTGRKNKWFSPFLLAVVDLATGEFQSLCRCMSGFTDEFYQEKLDRFARIVVETKPCYINTDEQPPFWFDPRLSEVWEVRGADLTLSPVHAAAKGLINSSAADEISCGRGLSLRFPRFIKVRSDKTVDQATTNYEALSLFHLQNQRHRKS